MWKTFKKQFISNTIRFIAIVSFSDYRYVVVIITVSAVISESMTHNSIYTILMRLLFICFGVILALIGNRFHRLEKRWVK